DVEEAALLGELLRRPRLLGGQLLLLEPRQEHELELEALRAVVGQEVDAAALAGAGAEATVELGLELAGGSVRQLLREPHQPGQVVLPRQLALAEPGGRALQPARSDGDRPHLLRDLLPLSRPPQHEARRLAREARDAL